MKIDKTVKEFLEKNKDITMVSFSWSLQWRLGVLISGIYLVLALLILVVGG